MDNLVRLFFEEGTVFPYLNVSDFDSYKAFGDTQVLSKNGTLKLKAVNITDIPEDIRNYLTNHEFRGWSIFLYHGYVVCETDDGYTVPFIGKNCLDYQKQEGTYYYIEAYGRRKFFPQR